MAMIRWNPLNITSLFDDDFELPTNLSRIIGQGLNLYETQDAFVAEAAMPGLKEDQIDITLDNGIVRISGSLNQSDEQKSKRRYFMSSLATTFNYSFKVPEGLIDDAEPEAELENGILKVRFRKAAKTEPKKVKVVARTGK